MFRQLIIVCSLFLGSSFPLWGLQEANAHLVITGTLPEIDHLQVTKRNLTFLITHEAYTGILADISVRGNGQSLYTIFVGSEFIYRLRNQPTGQNISYSLGFKDKRFKRNDYIYRSTNSTSLEPTPLYIYIDADPARKGFPAGKYVENLLLTFRFL